MDEKFLVKDLNYLTEMLRETENTKKKLSALRNPEQLRFKLLKIYSKKLTNINLKIAPQVMSIHRENLSFYHTKSKKIFWSVAIEFYQAPTLEKENKTSQIRILLDPQDEGMTLFEILSSVKIDNAQALLYLKQKLNSTSLSDGIKDAKLSCYLKLEENPREKQFKRCDHLEELQKILTGTSLIEYPCIYIVSYDDLDMFLKQVNIVKNK